MAGFLTKLEALWGAENVVDVFEDTGIATRARELNFGAYVVRNVLKPVQLDTWHRALQDSMIQIINDSGTTRAVDLKGDRKGSAFYRSIQCTSGGCTCK